MRPPTSPPLHDAARSLLLGSRQDAAMPLLVVIGLCGRPLQGLTDERRQRLRDHALEALLWIGAHRPRLQVASALLRALEVGGSGEGGPAAGGWEARLALRKGGGLAGPLARLADHLLATGTAAAADGASEAGDEPLGWRLTLEVDAGTTRTRIPAEDFLAIERGVRWVGAPRQLVGIAGGTPLRAVTPMIFGDGAVRYRRVREEVLAPFGTLRIVEDG